MRLFCLSLHDWWRGVYSNNLWDVVSVGDRGVSEVAYHVEKDKSQKFTNVVGWLWLPWCEARLECCLPFVHIGATVYKRMCSTQLSLTNGFLQVMVKRVRLQAASDLGQWTQVQWSSNCRYLIQRKGITSDHEADAKNMATSATFFGAKERSRTWTPC